jgi:hypothetical protein
MDAGAQEVGVGARAANQRGDLARQSGDDGEVRGHAKGSGGVWQRCTHNGR